MLPVIFAFSALQWMVLYISLFLPPLKSPGYIRACTLFGNPWVKGCKCALYNTKTWLKKSNDEDVYTEKNMFMGRAILTYSSKDLWTLFKEGSIPFVFSRTGLVIPPLWLESQVSRSHLDLFDSWCVLCMTIVSTSSIGPNSSFSELEAWENVRRKTSAGFVWL